MSFRSESENYRYWTQQEEELLEELVAKSTPIAEISKVLGRSYASCAGHSSLMGFQNKYSGPRKYSVDEDFWEEPNFINSYFAGILAADGCIILKEKRDNLCGTLSWQISIEDIGLLEKFKEITKFTGNIGHYLKDGKFNHVDVRINCEKWNKALIEKWNIVPKKTYRISPPNNLTEQQMFCWLIGYIDGDGTVFLNKERSQFIIRVTSCSEHLICFIHEFLKERFQQKFRNKEFSIPKKMKNTNCWHINICGIRALCLYHYLKQYNLPKLSRKWEQPRVDEYKEEMQQSFPHFFDFSNLPLPI